MHSYEHLAWACLVNPLLSRPLTASARGTRGDVKGEQDSLDCGRSSSSNISSLGGTDLSVESAKGPELLEARTGGGERARFTIRAGCFLSIPLAGVLQLMERICGIQPTPGGAGTSVRCRVGVWASGSYCASGASSSLTFSSLSVLYRTRPNTVNARRNSNSAVNGASEIDDNIADSTECEVTRVVGVSSDAEAVICVGNDIRCVAKRMQT